MSGRQSNLSQLSIIYNKIKGLSIILYGEPGVGKTYFCAHLAREAYNITKKRALWIALDENLQTNYGKQIKRIANAEWKVIDNSQDLWIYVATQLITEATNTSMVVLDSLTAIQEDILVKLTGPDDPRLTAIMSRYATLISKVFGRTAHKLGIPTIIIAHPTTLFKQSAIWENGLKPAFMGRAIKNSDLVLEYFITSKGRRYIKARIFRDTEKQPPIDYIDVDKALGENKEG